MRPRFAVPIVAAALAGASPLAAQTASPPAPVAKPASAPRAAPAARPTGPARAAALGAPARPTASRDGIEVLEDRLDACRRPRQPPQLLPLLGRPGSARGYRLPGYGSWSCWRPARSRPGRRGGRPAAAAPPRARRGTRGSGRRLRGTSTSSTPNRAAGHRPAARERAGEAGRRGDADERIVEHRAGPALGVRRAVRRDDHRGRARRPARRAGPGACARSPAVAGSRRPGARAADAARAARAAALEVLVQFRGAARHADTRGGGGRRARGPSSTRSTAPPGTGRRSLSRRVRHGGGGLRGPRAESLAARAARARSSWGAGARHGGPRARGRSLPRSSAGGWRSSSTRPKTGSPTAPDGASEARG